ncbi:hypothetical protein Tco_0812440 [Tanacetum coccineum]
MAGSGPANAIVRRAIDEISEFSGETETPKYMKVFISQEIVETRRFIRVQREEAQAVRSLLAQVRAIVTEMEAVNDPDEYYDSLRCLRESWKIREDKLKGLNETIAVAEDEISTLESHLEIMDAAINSDDRGQSEAVYAGKGNGSGMANDKLSDIAESPRLADKIKYVFGRSRDKDESFAKLMRDLCFVLRISLSKKRMWVAELKALRERGGVAKPFEHMKEIVARDAVTLGELETLLAIAQVGVNLKAGFVADMEERE